MSRIKHVKFFAVHQIVLLFLFLCILVFFLDIPLYCCFLFFYFCCFSLASFVFFFNECLFCIRLFLFSDLLSPSFFWVMLSLPLFLHDMKFNSRNVTTFDVGPPSSVWGGGCFVVLLLDAAVVSFFLKLFGPLLLFLLQSTVLEPSWLGRRPCHLQMILPPGLSLGMRTTAAFPAFFGVVLPIASPFGWCCSPLLSPFGMSCFPILLWNGAAFPPGWCCRSFFLLMKRNLLQKMSIFNLSLKNEKRKMKWSPPSLPLGDAVAFFTWHQKKVKNIWSKSN